MTLSSRAINPRGKTLYFHGGPLHRTTTDMTDAGFGEMKSLPTMVLLGRTIQIHDGPCSRVPHVTHFYQIIACQIFPDQDIYQCKYLGSADCPN